MAMALARPPLPPAPLRSAPTVLLPTTRRHLRTAVVASGKGAASPTLRTCKNCKQQYDPAANHPSACRFHTAHFGAQQTKIESLSTLLVGPTTILSLPTPSLADPPRARPRRRCPTPPLACAAGVLPRWPVPPVLLPCARAAASALLPRSRAPPSLAGVTGPTALLARAAGLLPRWRTPPDLLPCAHACHSLSPPPLLARARIGAASLLPSFLPRSSAPPSFSPPSRHAPTAGGAGWVAGAGGMQDATVLGDVVDRFGGEARVQGRHGRSMAMEGELHVGQEGGRRPEAQGRSPAAVEACSPWLHSRRERSRGEERKEKKKMVGPTIWGRNSGSLFPGGLL
ncbi:hypothetical protein PR202_gb03448 [Eleusine coracana subsp. coracana]|uniref:Uncharacterized protein n=1 Tax=Eleusine coracana subsp. coracana TaxID=191504 RepID=A0AAV5E0Z0_ELECO|nr:hypothetical protein PR202_gb03448 [Eleusine coracana subsp. coracana]